jgi:hypothetical protein
LEARFVHLIQTLAFDDEVLGWVTVALRQRHADEKRFHDEALARLQAEHTRLQGRIGAMYLDKLDGRVGAPFFGRKAAEWRTEPDQALRAIEEHQAASQTYMEQGVRILELARRLPGTVREAGASRETAPAELPTFEPHPEGRGGSRRRSANPSI